MTIKTFFMILAVLAAIHGIGFVLVPDPIASAYGVATSASTRLMAQLFGGALLAWGLIIWFAKDFRDEAAVRGVLIATCIADAVAICAYFEAVRPAPPLMGIDPQSKAVIAAAQRRAERDGFQAVVEAFRNFTPGMKGHSLPGPDGYEQIILDNPIRTRYRHGRDPDDVMLMTPGKPEELHIDLWNTAFTFEKGHKIQVTVTSSNSTKFEVNPNTGEPFGAPTPSEPRVATNTLYFDKRHPSAMILPVLSAAP